MFPHLVQTIIQLCIYKIWNIKYYKGFLLTDDVESGLPGSAYDVNRYHALDVLSGYTIKAWHINNKKLYWDHHFEKRNNELWQMLDMKIEIMKHVHDI